MSDAALHIMDDLTFPAGYTIDARECAARVRQRRDGVLSEAFAPDPVAIMTWLLTHRWSAFRTSTSADHWRQ